MERVRQSVRRWVAQSVAPMTADRLAPVTPARVVAVSARAGHSFSKDPRPSIRLLADRGVDGDGHLGHAVQHRSRARRHPTAPNLRQVHLLAAELLADLAEAGHQVTPGALGENVTTAHVDLLALPTDTVLRLGDVAEVVLTGLRNPCRQIEDFQPGLTSHLLGRDEQGAVVRRAGVMAVVRRGGEVRPGDAVSVELPLGPHRPLLVV